MLVLQATRCGAEAALAVLNATPETPSRIVGIRTNTVVQVCLNYYFVNICKGVNLFGAKQMWIVIKEIISVGVNEEESPILFIIFASFIFSF